MKSHGAALGLILLGLTPLLRGEGPPVDQVQSHYDAALIDYKTGKYGDAAKEIDAAEIAKPGDPATEILKARVLTEVGKFAEAKAVLESLNGNPALTPALDEARTVAFGDMCLRKRSFDEAAKFFESLLAKKPADPDFTLKVVYSRVGASDLVDAAKYAAKLKPLDPDHPCYYFAKAALAQATGKGQEAEDDIQTARTIYGITVANHYLKTYLEIFASSPKTPASEIAPLSPANSPSPR